MTSTWQRLIVQDVRHVFVRHKMKWRRRGTDSSANKTGEANQLVYSLRFGVPDCQLTQIPR